MDADRFTNAKGTDDFNLFHQRINGKGFTERLQYLVREGDISLDDSTSINARHIAISVKKGELNIAGDLNASGEMGGVIDLSSSGDMTLFNTANIVASGDVKGGTVQLKSLKNFDYSGDGSAEIGGLVIHNGAKIDVSGT